MSCIIRNDGNSKEMKTQLKRTIWGYEICCWTATQLFYPELELYYKMVRNISVNVWWQIAACNHISTSKIRSVVAIASGTQPKGLQCNFRYQQCRLCCEQRLNDAMHFLFQCPALEAIGSNTWTAVLDALPNAMAADISGKSWHVVLHLILSGFGDQYIPEWKSIYIRTACFIHSMYKERYEMERYSRTVICTYLGSVIPGESYAWIRVGWWGFLGWASDWPAEQLLTNQDTTLRIIHYAYEVCLAV